MQKEHYNLRIKHINTKKKKNDNYYTPKYIVDMFGAFDYDPATSVEQAKHLEIPNFDTIETNGLNTNWNNYKRIWLNPPFTNKKDFLKKAQEYYDSTGGEIYILLPIEFLTSKTFHAVVKGATIYLPNGRIKFEDPEGNVGESPAFGSVIIKLSKSWNIKELDINKESQ